MRKRCNYCGEFIVDVRPNVKCHSECRIAHNRKWHQDHYQQRRAKQKVEDVKRYTQNFNNVVDEPFKLTTKGFDSASTIKVKSYLNVFDVSWVQIIRSFGRFTELFEYVSSEYRNFVTTCGKQDMSLFCKRHAYITYDLVASVGINEIMKSAGRKKLRYTKQELYRNFQEIKRKVNRLPLFAEFEIHTKIAMSTYFYKFEIKPESYDAIVNMFADSDEEYAEYVQRHAVHKAATGRLTGPLSAIHSDEDYEKEFRRVFEECFALNGFYPPKRYFNWLSRIDESSYRKKYDSAWGGIYKMYNYPFEVSNRSERIVLESVKRITGLQYTAQMTWDWLIGVGGKHMYCDGYFENGNTKFVIEFDGVQHRTPLSVFGGTARYERRTENDHLKEKLLTENGIILIRIDSRHSWHTDDYIRQKLLDYKVIN